MQQSTGFFIVNNLGFFLFSLLEIYPGLVYNLFSALDTLFLIRLKNLKIKKEEIVKKNFNKKLTLKKSTVAHLDDNQMKEAAGGGDTKPPTRCDCYSADTNCPTRPGIACTT